MISSLWLIPIVISNAMADGISIIVVDQDYEIDILFSPPVIDISFIMDEFYEINIF